MLSLTLLHPVSHLIISSKVAFDVSDEEVEGHSEDEFEAPDGEEDPDADADDQVADGSPPRKRSVCSTFLGSGMFFRSSHSLCVYISLRRSRRDNNQ